MAYSEEAKKVVRQRLGLAENDTSQDERIDAMSPDSVFAQLCAWHLGSGSWADTIHEWMEMSNATFISLGELETLREAVRRAELTESEQNISEDE